jgi:hypothetical protein
MHQQKRGKVIVLFNESAKSKDKHVPLPNPFAKLRTATSEELLQSEPDSVNGCEH